MIFIVFEIVENVYDRNCALPFNASPKLTLIECVWRCPNASATDAAQEVFVTPISFEHIYFLSQLLLFRPK